MNENRRQILNMLAENKINAEEAERLIAALESPSSAGSEGSTANSSSRWTDVNGAEPVKSRPQFLRVLVQADPGAETKKGPVSVNIRVPMQLLRAGVRLASLIPVQAHRHLDEALSRHGVPLTLSQIKPENLEELIDHLDNLTIDVAAKEHHSDVKVRVFSE
jgi:hypothetical protein